MSDDMDFDGERIPTPKKKTTMDKLKDFAKIKRRKSQDKIELVDLKGDITEDDKSSDQKNKNLHSLTKKITLTEKSKNQYFSDNKD